MKELLDEADHIHVGDDNRTEGILLREDIKSTARQARRCKPGQVVRDKCSQRTIEVCQCLI